MKRQGINIENDTKLMKQFIELMRKEQQVVDNEKRCNNKDRRDSKQRII